MLQKQSAEFRHNTVQQITDLITSGESANVIGVSGVGKSNLFNHLLELDTQRQYFGQEFGRYLIIRVNFHYVANESARAIYSLILDEVEQLREYAIELDISDETLATVSAQHDALLDVRDDDLKVLHHFKRAIQALMRGRKHKLVFLFDQFEDIYRDAPPQLLQNLRGLREAYKYRVSYFVFTRNALGLLADENSKRDEFGELLSANIIGLPPYNEADSASMLLRVEQRTEHQLSAETHQKLIALCGGHGGILRAAYLACARDNIDVSAEALLKHPNITKECQKIWGSIPLEEQTVLKTPKLNEKMNSHRALTTKGILQDEKIFCPVFEKYVRLISGIQETGLSYDKATWRVFIDGDDKERLTKQEHLLFNCLYEAEGNPVSRDKLIEAGWPNAKGGVTDESVTQIIKRLRQKIEPSPSKPRYIITVRGLGYQLARS